MNPARPRRRHDFVIRLIVPRPVPSFTPGIKERRCGFADSRRKARLSGHQRSPNHRKGGHFMKRILCLSLLVPMLSELTSDWPTPNPISPPVSDDLFDLVAANVGAPIASTTNSVRHRIRFMK